MYRICLDNGDRTVNQGSLLVICIILVFRILSQDLLAYIFKGAREYKQCTSSNRINYNLDSFHVLHAQVRNFVSVDF